MTTHRLNFGLCLLESSSCVCFIFRMCESHSLALCALFFACVRVSLKLVLSHENKIKRVFVFVGSCNFIYAFSFTLFSLKAIVHERCHENYFVFVELSRLFVHVNTHT